MRALNYVKVLTLISGICCLAATPSLCHSQEAANQDFGAYAGLIQDIEQRSGSSGIPRSTEEGENVSVRDGAPADRYYEDDPERQRLWDAYRGTILGVKRNPQEKEKAAQEEGAVECDCEDDCKCPPLVCKASHCKSNFVVMFSATWCKPCHKMYPILKELRKEGYIVYIYTLNTEEFEDLNLDSKFQVRAYPTFVFFDKGKETHRMLGKQDIDKFYPHLVKESEQEKQKPKPDSDVYDGL